MRKQKMLHSVAMIFAALEAVSTVLGISKSDLPSLDCCRTMGFDQANPLDMTLSTQTTHVPRLARRRLLLGTEKTHRGGPSERPTAA